MFTFFTFFLDNKYFLLYICLTFILKLLNNEKFYPNELFQKNYDGHDALDGLPFLISSCYDDDDDDNGTNDMNIVEIAQQTPELSTLVDALVAAESDWSSFRRRTFYSFRTH